jgi:hypothetical protein
VCSSDLCGLHKTVNFFDQISNDEIMK